MNKCSVIYNPSTLEMAIKRKTPMLEHQGNSQIINYLTIKTEYKVMELHEKKEVQRLLDIYVSRYPSQAKAVSSLVNVSEATIINIRKGNWDSIAEAMWLNVGKQIGLSNKGAWNLVHTTHVSALFTFLEDARLYSNVFAIETPAGGGKTFPTQYYVSNIPNVYHIECSEYFNKKTFLSKLLQKMGKENTGYAINEMIDEIVDLAHKQENPLIIIDEVDKLNDQVLYFFITLYNLLIDKCGIVMMATPEFEKRISRGLRLNKRGYAEIFSRIGRKFIELPKTSSEEIAEICKANGLDDLKAITEICNECEGDLRRVKRGVHKMKKLKSNNQPS